MSRSVYVHAPCRLHFGMFSFGHADRPQFGGVGVMVEPPAIEVKIVPAAEFIARGSLARRVDKFVASVATNWQLPALPRCEIRVTAPPDHVGLGVGTQLGLGVAAGLRRYLDLPPPAIGELAQSVGRGARSAVGTYGFHNGGFIVDGGKESGTTLGRIARRIEVPTAWRFVLVRCGRDGRGLAGDREAEAFARLPIVLPNVTDELWRVTNEEMIPAIERADCDAFGDAAYRFGRLAGECFAPVQGGAFANADTAELVDAIRNHGVPGVGQSSWGPTVFTITADEAAARSLVAWLRNRLDRTECEISIARPNNVGAQLSTLR